MIITILVAAGIYLIGTNVARDADVDILLVDETHKLQPYKWIFWPITIWGIYKHRREATSKLK